MVHRPSLRLLFAAALILFSLAACDSKEEKEAKYISRGNALFEQGEYDKARLEYKNAGRINPVSAEVSYRLGLVNEAQNDLRGAFLGFTAAAEQDPRYAPALLKLAQYYLAAEQDDKAQKYLSAAFEIDPENAQAHALRAAFLFGHDSYPEAEKEAQTALAKDPANVTAFTILARAYELQNEPDKAAAAIEDGIAKNPKELSLLLMKAMFYTARNDKPKIVEAYEAIFKLKPDAPRFRTDLARLLVKLNDKPAAEKVLRDGVARAPGDKPMLQALIGYLDRNEGLEAAEKELQKAQQADPSDGEYVLWLADLYLNHKDTDRAVALLQDTIAKKTGGDVFLREAKIALARLYLSKDEKEEARKLVDEVLGEQSDYSDALFLRARFAFEKGDYQNAVTDLRTVLRDNPRSRPALQLMAETLLAQDRLDLAIDTLAQLVAADPSYMEAQVRLAQLYAMRGDKARALEILRIVQETKPDMAVAWENGARIAIAAKDFEKAEAAITKLAALPGQEPLSTFLKGALAAAKGQTAEAVGLYKKAVRTDPQAPLSTYALAALLDVSQTPEQLKELVSFLKGLSPQSSSIEALLGECYLKLAQGNEAAEALDRALALKPDNPAPYLLRAQLWADQNKLDEALAVLEQAQRAFPGDTRAATLKADVLTRQQRYGEAIKIYEALLEKNPNDAIAANNMAQLIADEQSGDAAALERARVAAERFVSSDNPLFLDTLAWVYFRQGNLPQAQIIMDRVMTFGDKLPPQVFYHQGAILLKNGRAEEAKAALQKALARPEPYSGRGEAEKMLKGL